MTGRPGGRLTGPSAWALRLAARLVPRARRAEWLEEWEAELWHLRHRTSGSAAETGYRPPERWRSTPSFVAGAIRHAMWVRSQQWQPQGEGPLANALLDVRYGARVLRRSPGFALVVILTMGLGIGANTAVFSVVDGVILRPLPYPDASRLVRVGWDWSDSGGLIGALAPFKFAYLRDKARSFAGLTTWLPGTRALGSRGADGLVNVLRVSDDFFDVVGFRPSVGRAFGPDEQVPGADQAAILTDRLWRTRFNRDRAVLGRRLVLDDRDYTIVGVMPTSFAFPEEVDPVDVILPLALRPNPMDLGANYPVLGRLAPGVSSEAASEDLARVFARLHVERPEQFSDPKEHAGFIDFRSLYLSGVEPTLWALFGAVGLVLLVSCTNVANLLIARGAGRGREMALRATLGAARWRIGRQILAEGLVLATAGGLVGFGMGWIGVRLLVHAAPPSLARIAQVGLDGRVLAFTTALSLLTGLFFSLVTALPAMRIDLARAMRPGTRAGTATRRGVRGRHLLIGAEVALAVVLLAGAGLLITSFVRLHLTDLGFDPDRVATLSFRRLPAAYADATRRHAFETALLERLRALPGVTAAATVSVLPLDRHGMNFPMTLAGRPEASEGAVEWRTVSPAYFDLLGLHLVHGRGFTPEDVQTGRPVAIVNESFARRYFPDADPLAGAVQLGLYQGRPLVGPDFDTSPLAIVGVVADSRELGPAVAPRRTVFTVRSAAASDGVGAFLVRTNGGVTAPMLIGAVAAVDPTMPVPQIGTLTDRLGQRLAQDRFNTTIMSLFAGAALLLTALGIYGVVSWMVRQRTTEIGIRMALGASRRGVVGQAVARGMTPVLGGLAVGLAGALGATRALTSMLHGLSATDPLTFTSVGIVLVLVALLASWLPARRAATVDPVIALRSE